MSDLSVVVRAEKVCDFHVETSSEERIVRLILGEAKQARRARRALIPKPPNQMRTAEQVLEQILMEPSGPSSLPDIPEGTAFQGGLGVRGQGSILQV